MLCQRARIANYLMRTYILKPILIIKLNCVSLANLIHMINKDYFNAGFHKALISPLTHCCMEPLFFTSMVTTGNISRNVCRKIRFFSLKVLPDIDKRFRYEVGLKIHVCYFQEPDRSIYARIKIIIKLLFDYRYIATSDCCEIHRNQNVKLFWFYCILFTFRNDRRKFARGLSRY